MITCYDYHNIPKNEIQQKTDNIYPEMIEKICKKLVVIYSLNNCELALRNMTHIHKIFTRYNINDLSEDILLYSYAMLIKLHSLDNITKVMDVSELSYLFLIIFNISYKLLRDNTFNNNTISNTFKINKKRLLQNEMTILTTLKWKLFLSFDDIKFISKEFNINELICFNMLSHVVNRSNFNN
jgi:hypothetical protein